MLHKVENILSWKAIEASRAQLMMLDSAHLLAAVLIALVCWTPAACASSVGSVCLPDPRPHDATVWNDNPADVSVTVVWTVEAVTYIISKTNR